MRKIQKKLPSSPPVLFQRAKQIRKNMTNSERKMWTRLRSNRMNVKFRRQEPIGNYIVDFVCIERGIIVEIDGSHHGTENIIEYDRGRDEYLSRLGFRVLRFNNFDVLRNMEVVLSVIFDALSEK